jgi:hypothetical protein
LNHGSRNTNHMGDEQSQELHLRGFIFANDFRRYGRGNLHFYGRSSSQNETSNRNIQNQSTMNNLSKLNNWERKKAIYLLHSAEQFGLQTSEHTQIGVNPHSGNTWVWDEMWPVSLFMTIFCDLEQSSVWVCWTNPEDGDEHEDQLTSFQDLDALNKWVRNLEREFYQD